MKELIVIWLEKVCTFLDDIPSLEWNEHGKLRPYRYGCWGCRLQLSGRSSDLDEKWGTGVWKEFGNG